MKTFLVTGVGSGLGAAFARRALAVGHRVIGTVRREEQRVAFEEQAPGRAIGRILDLTHEDEVAEVVGGLGPIEVLIANAGYGHEGTFEESTMQDLKRQFDVNVFGTVAVMKAVLGGMRERRLASRGKQLGNPDLAADAVLTVLDAENPPVHLLLGSDALRLVAAGRARFDRDVEAWRELSASTDFPDGTTIG